MPLQKFVDYQREFRVPFQEHAIRQEWNNKSQGDKTKRTKAHNKCFDKSQSVGNLRAAADAVRDQIRHEIEVGNLLIDTARAHDAYKDRINTLQTQYESLKEEHEECVRLWSALHVVEVAQPNAHPQSLQEPQNRQQQQRQAINGCDNEIQALWTWLERPPVVYDPQGRPRMPDVWLPGRDRHQISFARRVADDVANHRVRLQNVNGQTWRKAGEELGGGLSTGTIWVRFDDNEAIIDRVVRKDCLVSEEGWVDPTRWEGNMRSGNKMPLEIVITDEMQRVPTLQNTVRMREAPNRSRHVSNRRLTYRMYLEYVGKGDLHRMIHRHRVTDQLIPEPFIWYVAEALALCGKAMHEGTISGDYQPLDWKEVVHRDLKSSNVFLESIPDGAANQIYPHYDKPRLGDYGLAVKTDDNDILNPRWYNNRWGTPGFLAPEQGRHIDVDTLETIDEWRLGEKTNVYGVGLILYCLVQRQLDLPEPVWLGNPELDQTLMIPPAVMAQYSMPLITLINQCLAYDHTHRPGFNGILQLIRIQTDEAGPNLAMNMRSGTAQGNQHLPVPGLDPYQEGMTAAHVGIVI